MSAFAEDGEEEEYEEISAEEKLRIATHFLLSAPAGEIKELLADVRKVVAESGSDDVLTDAALGNIFRTYNIENHTLAETEAGSFMLVSKHGEVDGTHYIDPRAGKVYGFNHMTQSWDTSDSSDAPVNDALEEQRAAVQTALDAYMAAQYSDISDAKSAVAVYATADDTLVCCLAGTATNLRNWWSGGWKGEFTIKLAAGGSAQVTGKCDLLAHYFEDGNVQMNTSREYSEDGVGYGSADELGEAIVTMIKKWESTLQAGLETMYTGMRDQTFKDMRRILPVTYTKFDWSGQQQKLAGGAGSGTL